MGVAYLIEHTHQGLYIHVEFIHVEADRIKDVGQSNKTTS